MTRIESWASLGFPDCVVGLNNKFLLIELKIAKANGSVDISAHQVSFHTSYAGFPCFLLVSVGSNPNAQLFLYKADQIKELALTNINKVNPVFKSTQDSDGWAALEYYLTEAVSV